MKATLLNIVILAAMASSFSVALAQEGISPPIINFYNKQIGNNEIFYVGGSSAFPEADVIIYVQEESGSLISETVQTDDKGIWFYSHPKFLYKGNYFLWTQVKVNDQLSPPSPQINFKVNAVALQIGDKRIDYEVLSAILFIMFLIIAIIAVIFIFYHARQHKIKNNLLEKDIAKAEATVHHGFVQLKKDIIRELALAKSSRDTVKESAIFKDLEVVERHIEKELARIETI